jgi:hypothetical protein
LQRTPCAPSICALHPRVALHLPIRESPPPLSTEPSDHRPLAGRPPLPNAHGPQPSHRTGAASQRCRPLAWSALVTGMESMSGAPKVSLRRTQWRLISAIWPAELHVRPNQDHISLGGDHKSRGAGVWLPALASTTVDFHRSSDPFRQSH